MKNYLREFLALTLTGISLFLVAIFIDSLNFPKTELNVYSFEAFLACIWLAGVVVLFYVTYIKLLNKAIK